MRKTGQQLVKEFRALWGHPQPAIRSRHIGWGAILRNADFAYRHRKDIKRFNDALTKPGTRKSYRSLPYYPKTD